MLSRCQGVCRQAVVSARCIASTSDAVICRYSTAKAQWDPSGVVGVAHYSRKTKVDAPRKLEDIVVPVTVPYAKDFDTHNVGAELVGNLNKQMVTNILSQFPRINEIRAVAKENGITDKLFHQCFVSFRKFCVEQHPLPVELHIQFADIIQGKGHVTDLFPSFLAHAHKMFPHLEAMGELKQLSDLRQPHMWYTEARAMKRKIIFHAGPTNSGKTHQALQRFKASHSGVYCGPLKLLANEVFFKMNAEGHHCDLLTGEEKRFAVSADAPARHVACTVEMVNTTTNFEVAVIDEIQMVRDVARGWAWTRALLGVCAEEVHVCGEPAALEIIQQLVETCGETVDTNYYERMSPLKIAGEPLGTLENVQPGDCIVCFNRNDIFSIVSQLDQLGIEVAVIYGALPPGTKLAQAARFNDPKDPCKVLVSTDAIGMGLNLSIKRIIFASITKANLNLDGSKTIGNLHNYAALQIAGRAGRFGTEYEQGEVSCLRGSDLVVLKSIMASPVEPIGQAGMYPTLDQVESFSYHLPRATLVNIIDVFVSLCEMDEKFFMCNMDDFRFFAACIENLPLPLKVRYTFSLSPINRFNLLTVEYLKKYARSYSRGHPITMDWLQDNLMWPMDTPKNLENLVRCEQIFDCLELYRWLGIRFPDMFPDCDGVKGMQIELDQTIQQGVKNVKVLLASITEKQNEQKGKKKSHRPKLVGPAKGKISKSLIEDGTVPVNVMEKLKLELKQDLMRALKSKKRSPNVKTIVDK